MGKPLSGLDCTGLRGVGGCVRLRRRQEDEVWHAGDSVAIDGTPLETATGRIVAVGTFSLTVSNSDYYPWSQRLEVAYDLTNHCEVVLKPKPALLSVEVTPAVRYQLHDGSGRLIALEEVGTAKVPRRVDLEREGSQDLRRLRRNLKQGILTYTVVLGELMGGYEASQAPTS
jgi:hypothetical protein